MSIPPLTRWQIREMSLNMEINETNHVIKQIEKELSLYPGRKSMLDSQKKYFEARRDRYLDEIFEMTVLGGAEALADE